MPTGSLGSSERKTSAPIEKPETHQEVSMNDRERMTVEPGKRGGRPCVRGLRITVDDVLDQLSTGMSPEQIIEDFPELELEDIHACLGFAADRERPIAGLQA
jgi:uncharacterized protein (DUF433 family)